MKRMILLGSIAAGALLGFAPTASAQWAVTDIESHLLDTLGLGNQATQIAKAVAQLEQLQQQYQVLMQQYGVLTQQYQAVAHLPDQVTGMAGSLTTSPSLQDPLPQANSIAGIVNGSSLGSVSGLAGNLASTNRYYDPTGGDDGATEMMRRRSSTSGIEAMAMDGIASLQKQTRALGEFLANIGSSPDVQQSSAINARLALEQNYAARQQAAATHLQTLAMMQQTVSQQRDAEASRKAAEEWRDKTAGAFSGNGQ